MEIPDQVFRQRALVLHQADVITVEELTQNIQHMLGTTTTEEPRNTSIWNFFNVSPVPPASPIPSSANKRKIHLYIFLEKNQFIKKYITKLR